MTKDVVEQLLFSNRPLSPLCRVCWNLKIVFVIQVQCRLVRFQNCLHIFKVLTLHQSTSEEIGEDAGTGFFQK